MTQLAIGEAITVQFPMINHAVGIGWNSITPQAAEQKRGGEAGIVFRDELEVAPAKFNSWMSPNTIRQVIEKLEAIPPTIEGNREMLAWLRGERQWYDENEERHRPVQIIDFETAGNNVFNVTWESKLKPPARKGNRADLMFVVNGVPVCIVEHKNPKDGGAIERAVTQLKRYEKETPELIGAPQTCGRIGASRKALLSTFLPPPWAVGRRSVMALMSQTGGLCGTCAASASIVCKIVGSHIRSFASCHFKNRAPGVPGRNFRRSPQAALKHLLSVAGDRFAPSLRRCRT